MQHCRQFIFYQHRFPSSASFSLCRSDKLTTSPHQLFSAHAEGRTPATSQLSITLKLSDKILPPLAAVSLCQPSPAPHWLVQSALSIHSLLSALTVSVRGCLSACCCLDPQTLSQRLHLTMPHCTATMGIVLQKEQRIWFSKNGIFLCFYFMVFLKLSEKALTLISLNTVKYSQSQIQLWQHVVTRVLQRVTLLPVWEVWDYEFWSVSDKQSAILSQLWTVLTGSSVKRIVNKGQHLTFFFAYSLHSQYRASERLDI